MSKIETFAERLKASRKRLGLSQQEVAQRAGIKQTSYSELEQGRSKMTRSLLQLADALRVDPHWLATGIKANTYEDQLIEEIRLMNEAQQRTMLEFIQASKKK